MARDCESPVTFVEELSVVRHQLARIAGRGYQRHAGSLGDTDWLFDRRLRCRTVVFNGELRKSCLALAQAADGAKVQTIEAADEVLDALRRAFIDFNGFQCGYCTSGMLLIAADLLRCNRSSSISEIREAISGNLCRCTGYDAIVDAIGGAAQTLSSPERRQSRAARSMLDAHRSRQ